MKKGSSRAAALPAAPVAPMRSPFSFFSCHVVMGLGAPAGNAATRIEVYVTKNGIYSSGVVPEIEDLFQQQAKELDRKKREALLHQIQKIVVDQAMVAPIFQQGFIWGVGSRVEVPGAGLIQGYPYAAPCEDMKLK